ncbi:TPA: hypothetical protein DEP21_05745 [Patescibacteria group bacterium]|nr:hypothetical protein [Candidatus Gracilibacteria bacterium]
MVGLYDSSSNQVGSLSPSGELKIFPAYADRYKVTMDLSSSLPVVRVLDMITSSTLFSIRLPAEKLVDISLYQQKPFYDKVDLTDASFGEFTNGSCIQGIDKQCIIYIAPDGLLYIPKNYAQSLKAIYHYDMINQQVNYTIQDFQSKDIAMITVKVNVLAQ